jgi:hypothetical protein
MAILHKSSYFLSAESSPTGSRRCDRRLTWRVGKPSGSHSLANTLLPPTRTPTTIRGMATHNMAMNKGLSGGSGVSDGSSSVPGKIKQSRKWASRSNREVLETYVVVRACLPHLCDQGSTPAYCDIQLSDYNFTSGFLQLYPGVSLC